MNGMNPLMLQVAEAPSNKVAGRVQGKHNFIKSLLNNRNRIKNKEEKSVNASLTHAHC